MIRQPMHQQFAPTQRLRNSWQASSAPRCVAILGGAVLAAGVAAPLIHIPIAGTVSYLRHPSYLPGRYNEGAAVVLAAAGLSIVLALIKRFKLLWLTGTVALAQLIGTMIAFQHNAASIFAP